MRWILGTIYIFFKFYLYLYSFYHLDNISAAKKIQNLIKSKLHENKDSQSGQCLK